MRFIPWDTRWTGAASIRPAAAASDSRCTRGSESVVGWRTQRRTRALNGSRSRATRTEEHPLLGRHFKLAHPAGTHFWEVTLDKRALPYLDDHRIEGVAVLPASAYVEMALAAAVEVSEHNPSH